MNLKVTVALAVILLALVAAYQLLPSNASGIPGVTPTPAGRDETLLSGEVSALEVRAGGSTVAIDKAADGQFQYSLNGATPEAADQSRVSSIATRLNPLKAQSRVVDAAQPDQLAEYGLNPVEASVTVRTSEQSTTLSLGRRNPGGTGYYAMVEGNPGVYLIDALLGDDLVKLTTQPPTPPTPTPVPSASPAPATPVPSASP